jgi:hypothetical protein
MRRARRFDGAETVWRRRYAVGLVTVAVIYCAGMAIGRVRLRSAYRTTSV